MVGFFYKILEGRVSDTRERERERDFSDKTYLVLELFRTQDLYLFQRGLKVLPPSADTFPYFSVSSQDFELSLNKNKSCVRQASPLRGCVVFFYRAPFMHLRFFI